MDDLQALSGVIANADATAAGVDAPAQANPQPGGALVAIGGADYAQEAAGMVDMFAALVCGFAPPAEAVWTDKARARTAQALAPVLAKYNVSMGTLPPELTLAVVAGPLLWQSARIMGAEMARKKREADAARTVDEPRRPDAIVPPAGQPGAPEGDLGPAVHPQVDLYR